MVFIGIGLDFASKDPAFPGNEPANGTGEFQFKPDDNELEEGILGFAYKASEFSIGKHISASELFGPSVYNFLNFSMAGLDDDRIDLYSSAPSATIRASSIVGFDSGFSTTGSLAVDVEDSSGSKVTVDYDLVIESTLPKLQGVLISIAAKSLSGSSPEFEVNSYGVKLSVFESKGMEFALGYSRNDFGDYFEFGSSKTIGYRHKIGLGFSVFDADNNQPDIPNRSEILDSDFYYINYAYAFSRFLHGFIEFDSIDFGDWTERVSLVGLRLSF
ncbi:hypothetical protein ACFL1S_06470 [Pseudomonadota bacterium]